MTSLLHTVLWDLDGTLLDSTPLWRAAEYEFLGRRGLAWSDDNSMRLVGGNLERVSSVFAEVTGQHFSVELLREEMAASVLRAITHQTPWAPGARELVEELASMGTRQGIVTSSYRDIGMAVMAETPAFDPSLLVSREDVAKPKPDPEPYRVAADRLGIHLPAAGVLVIEDSESGIRSARSAGFPVLAIAENRLAEHGVMAVDSLTECTIASSKTWLSPLGLTLGRSHP